MAKKRCEIGEEEDGHRRRRPSQKRRRQRPEDGVGLNYDIQKEATASRAYLESLRQHRRAYVAGDVDPSVEAQVRAKVEAEA